MNWDFRNSNVVDTVDATAFPTAETILIAAGEPTFNENFPTVEGSTGFDLTGVTPETEAQMKGSQFSPLGLVETVGLSQNVGNQKIFEIGSARSYIIPGKYAGSLNLSRVLGFHESILRAMFNKRKKVQERITTLRALNSTQDLPGEVIGGTTGLSWFNIGSHVFLEQIGLLFWMVGTTNPKAATATTGYADYGAFYMEHGMVSGHNFGVNAGAVVLMESVGMMFERLVPVSVTPEYQSAVITSMGEGTPVGEETVP